MAGNSGNKVVELSPSDLKHSGSPAPVVLDSAALDFPQGVAFDQSKNLWVTTLSNRLVLEFTPAQLKALGTVSNPTPAATIQSASFNLLNGCTFDRNGNLWIIDEFGNAVHELTKTQLNAGSNANITPAINITSSSVFDAPIFGAFDQSGNLWISANNSQIVEFSSGQLGSSGDKVPTIILSSSGDSIGEPAQIVFDRKGNLWVSNGGVGTVVMFAKNQLGATGSPIPKVTLSGAGFSEPWGLAFDTAHNLWVGDVGDGNIAKFSSKQLKKSGSPMPSVVLQGALSSSYHMTFGPVF